MSSLAKIELAAKEIPYVDFAAQYAEERDEIHACVEAVFRKGEFVGGELIALLEEKLADYCGVEHVITVNSGTDALVLSMRALGIGKDDEVITPPNSFIASTAAIIAVGATPVFADVGMDQNINPYCVEAAISDRTKAIMPVHLSGRVADMNSLMSIARAYNLYVIEDAAQSIGSRYRNNPSGSFGHAAAFSTHPLKNLNAAGDGGFITTNDKNLAGELRLLRNHGLVNRDTVIKWGTVSRMDTLQAALLLSRLDRLDNVIETRRRHADIYIDRLKDSEVFIPVTQPYEFHSYHTFVIQTRQRNALRDYLTRHGIGTGIHYPVPIHLQPVAGTLGYRRGDLPVTEKQADEILTLPVHQYLTDSDIHYIASLILEFYS